MSYKLSHIVFNPLLFIAYSLYLIACMGCTKTIPTHSSSSSFIKAIPMDTDYNPISSFQASDGNYIVFEADPNYVESGWMLKFSSAGAMLWKKRLPANLFGLITKVIPVQGNSFV